MSKYKFSVGQRVMHNGRVETISSRRKVEPDWRKVEPDWVFGNYYKMPNDSLMGYKELSESELTAIKEDK